jgi:hypothetical protein
MVLINIVRRFGNALRMAALACAAGDFRLISLFTVKTAVELAHIDFAVARNMPARARF